MRTFCACPKTLFRLTRPNCDTSLCLRMPWCGPIIQFQFLLLFLLVSCTQTHNNRRRCETMNSCLCKRNNGSRIAVDCSSAGLNSSQVCGICRLNNFEIISLDVSNNSLSDVPSYCFQDCKSLEELSLAFNNLNQLSNKTFEGLSNLKYLNLDDNKLMNNGELSGQDFLQPLLNLQELHLQRNVYSVSEIDMHFYLSNVAGNSLIGLNALYLDGLPHAKFGRHFQNLKNLTRIDFSGKRSDCKIVALTNDSFTNVTFVTHLDLSYCNIATIEAGAFACLRDLKHLDLSYNMELGFVTLRNVTYGLQFTSIEVLRYSKVYKTFGLMTRINKCDVCFLQNTTLKEFHLNSNRIGIVEIDALAYLPATLETIYAEDNHLVLAPYTLQLGCLTNVKRVELSGQLSFHSVYDYNKELFIHEKVSTTSECILPPFKSTRSCKSLQNKPLFIGDLTLPEQLEIVNYRSSLMVLENTPLKFPLMLNNSLKSLDFSGNTIYNWSGYYIFMNKLEYLNLSDNSCGHISENFFSNAPNVRYLDAGNNKLGQQLAGDLRGLTFKHLKKLTNLNLHNNLINTLPENAFCFSSTLEILDLSLNRLDNIDFRFQHMRNLSNLYLQENRLSTLPLKLLEQMAEHSSNMSIDLSNNLLSLSCSNLEFIKWMSEHPQNFVNIELYTFVNNSGKVIVYKDISFETFVQSCQSYTFLIAISILLIFVFISITFGGIVYRYRWRLRYMYYMVKAKYNGYIQIQDAERDKEFQYDAFISYANENYQFATREMFQTLVVSGLSLCLHQKDFLPGTDIAENILQAIRNSRKTVIILTNDFLESKWCMYEFNMGRMESIFSRNGENIIIVVKYADIDMTRVSPELQECLESESYLEYPAEAAEQPYFWEMLVRILKRQIMKTDETIV